MEKKILFLEGEDYQRMIEVLNKKAIYSRNKELVSFYTNVEAFEELDKIKRPVSDGYCYLSSKEESTIRSCFCKMKNGLVESLEDIYFKYYPTNDNGLTVEMFLNALEDNIVDRRKNSKLYKIRQENDTRKI